jgi:hypothetical protein
MVIAKNNTANRRPHLNHHLLNKGDFTLFLFGHHMKLGALSLTEGFSSSAQYRPRLLKRN